MSFDPSLYRNESEVESKLIVSYLLPKLGYSPDSWHQEVALGSIRLDFLAFATQVLPFVLSANSPLSIVMEAKSPRQNLDKHVLKFRRYLTSLNVLYGLLTNGKEIRIYERVLNDIQLVFSCKGDEVEEKFQEIKEIIGKDSLKDRSQINVVESTTTGDPTLTVSKEVSKLNQESNNMKVIAIYHNKGGVGKTTTVVNLAAALSKKGKRVLVIDLDSQANTTFAMGLVKFDDEELDTIKDSYIYHILKYADSDSISEVARKSSFNNPEIDVVPAHITLMQAESEFNNLRSSQTSLIKKLKPVEHDYDIVIIDTPPSLNLYAYIALLTADYLIIPSDLKPFANIGLKNVREYIQKDVNEYREMINKEPLKVLGVLPCKIPTYPQFVKFVLPKHIASVSERYALPVMETIIYQREELAKCLEQVEEVGDLQIPDPKSVFEYKPDGESAREFEALATEVLQKIR